MYTTKNRTFTPEILQGPVSHVERSTDTRGTTGAYGTVSTNHVWSFRIGTRPATYSRKASVVSLSDGDSVTGVGISTTEGTFSCWALRNDSTGVTYAPTIGLVRLLAWVTLGLGLMTFIFFIGIPMLWFSWMLFKSAKQNVAMMKRLEATPPCV